MNFFKRIYGVIISPRETLKEVSENSPLWQGILALVVPAIISVILVFNRNTFMNTLGPASNPYTMNQIDAMIPMFISFGIFAAMFLTPIMHFIGTSIYHLLASFLGNDGRGKGLFNSLAFANIPTLISSIIYVIFVNFNLSILSTIISIGIWIWTIVLKIFAIQGNYKISGGKATLIYFIPFITAIVILGFMIILGILTMIPIISSLADSYGMPM